MARHLWADSDVVYRAVLYIRHEDVVNRQVVMYGPYGSAGTARSVATQMANRLKEFPGVESVSTYVEISGTDWALLDD
jgi:hypothetical protein